MVNEMISASCWFILKYVVFGFNMFMAGHYYASEYYYLETRRERIWSIIICAGIMLFGVLGIFLYLVFSKAWKVLKYLDDRIQIIFFATYFFYPKMYCNIEERNLEYANEKASMMKNDWHGKLYKYCIVLVNKKNNYTYTPRHVPESATEIIEPKVPET